ncbi:lytic polysaccharide monooxygenase auxiliary activity family 9 protein [Streptomyces sp. 4N509B]|uniref:lytic polysaccharide monooxygenase auxiliary activity family 9 protein n=1 Tax=Streptomyces sp. 4N509B TaxID=3457413 RepID=UPI003FD1685B
MHAKRKLALVIGAAVAPLIAVTLPANTASAHGYINSPPSRQAQCYEGTVDCGQIKYEPWSVEAPKGSMQCNGGNSRFPDLNDNSKPWVATPVSRTTQFHWILQANHATSTWQYYVNGRKVAEFDDGGAMPPTSLSHTVDLQASGRQTVLAVWNIADTPNAFYACIDVNIQ